MLWDAVIASLREITARAFPPASALSVSYLVSAGGRWVHVDGARACIVHNTFVAVIALARTSRVATSAGVLCCDCALCASPTAGLNDNDHAQSSSLSKQLKQLACQTYHSQHTTTTHHEWKQFETTPTTTLTPIDNLNSPPHIYNNDFHKQNTKTTAQLLPRNHRYWNS